jgi:hypothetical protein
MHRERALKVMLGVVGVLFTAGIYPLAMRLLHPQKCEYSDVMLLSLYVTLGIFLLVAVRSPSAYRSLIAFAANGRVSLTPLLWACRPCQMRTCAETFTARLHSSSSVRPCSC